MARKFLTPIDMALNAIRNLVLDLVASDPGSPSTGQVWYNTTTNRLKWRNNSATIDPVERANHQGTQTAATISDFDTQVRTSRLDQMASPTAAVSMNSQRITNLAAPSSANDAVRKTDLDSISNGTDWKQSVRVATTANITLSGLQTIDGVSVGATERVLVKDQSTGADNGIYLAASGAWARAADAATGTLTAAAAVFVEEGTTQADTQWRLTTNDPITIGSTAQNWAQMGAGSSYTEGTGIDIAGSVINVDTAVVVRKYSATIGDGSSTTITVTHSLGSKDGVLSVRQVSDDAEVECDVVWSSTTQVQLTFAVAPASSALRVTVHV
jgi:hypothetical protein